MFQDNRAALSRVPIASLATFAALLTVGCGSDRSNGNGVATSSPPAWAVDVFDSANVLEAAVAPGLGYSSREVV